MTVSDISGNKIKITLSNFEVLDCFGTYERLYSMTESIKGAFKQILKDVLSKRGVSFNEEMLIQIKARKNIGCVIILSPIAEKKQKKEYLFIFKTTEDLTRAILFLYRIDRNLKSTLYKTEYDYRLIITSKTYKPCFINLNEFCSRQTESVFEVAYTKEHGKILIEKNAVKTYGTYFSKEI